MTASNDRGSSARTPHGCRDCGALLAIDQRYCVECGARVRPHPYPVWATLRAIEQSRPGPAWVPLEAEDATTPVPAAAPTRTGPLFPFPLPSPRAAAVAVLGTLAFGVAVGSGTESLAGAPPIVVALGGGSTAAPTPTSAIAPPITPASPANGSAASTPAASATSSSVPAAGSTLPATTATSTPSSTTPTSTTPTSTLPPVKHLFLIVLGDQGYSSTFSPTSRDRYLNAKLAAKGELIPNYYAVAQGELANEIAMVSGQGPTVATATGCPRFAQLRPARASRHGQVLGTGCVYPRKTQTLTGQLGAAHLSWKAYVEGLGARHRHQSATCARPVLGARDRLQTATAKDAYVTWRNPFVYFTTLTSGKHSACASGDVGLTQLATDLKSAKATPAFSYIAPGPCDDGSASPCHKHAKAGLGPADAFLRRLVPEIMGSAAYKDGGMIVITFDQAPQTGANPDQSSCCGNPQAYPNLPKPAATTTTTTPTPTTTTPTTTTGTTPAGTTTTGTTPTPTTTTTTGTTTSGAGTTTTTATTTPAATTTTPTSLGGGQTSPSGGGGQLGMLVISSYVNAGTTDSFDYFNHYSLLASIENLFSLKHLGYAADSSLPVFGGAVYSAYRG